MKMARSIMCKLLQKKTYDILSYKHSLILLVVGIILIIVSAFRFGEAFLEWSKDKYAAVFNSFSDNVMSKSYQSKLCQYLPIDVVYTWVNGSDPKLLSDLAKFKEELEAELNISRYDSTSSQNRKQKCPFAHCIQSHMVILRPVLPPTVKLEDLMNAEYIFTEARKIFTGNSIVGNKDKISGTVVIFDSKEAALVCQKKGVVAVQGLNYTVSPAFLTTEWTAPNSILMEDVVIMTRVDASVTAEHLHRNLPRSIQPLIIRIFLYPEKSEAVLLVPDKTALERVLQLEGNFSIDNKTPSFSTANLLLDFTEDTFHEDISASRFQDNEELRYSLRSIEKYAPWVRHVYIVTNGQIPYWLNLENPHVTIVTHEEIFLNKSHLPTFGSPAIETHLHRIPNLSKKFLYINDDVIFGKEIWPEDFYSHAKGHKVYLAWSVPECREGCPSTWINDGYCDKPCNNSDCQWDGGDCKDGATGMHFGTSNKHNFEAWKEESEKMYCQPNCANTWLGDRYCDQACNLLECGFDVGDCGTSHYDQIFEVHLDERQHFYVLPQGTFLAYFNLSTFLGEDGTITDGSYEDADVVRVITANQKYKVLTLVLYLNHNTTTLIMSIKGIRNNIDYQFNFNTTVNTLHVKSNNLSKYIDPVTSSVKVDIDAISHLGQTFSTSSTTAATLYFRDFPEDQREPHVISMEEDSHLLNSPFSSLNLSAVDLPLNVSLQLQDLQKKFDEGDITDKGFQKRKAQIIQDYLKKGKIRFDSLPLIATYKMKETSNSFIELNETKNSLQESSQNLNKENLANILSVSSKFLVDNFVLKNSKWNGSKQKELTTNNREENSENISNPVSRINIGRIDDLKTDTVIQNYSKNTQKYLSEKNNHTVKPNQNINGAKLQNNITVFQLESPIDFDLLKQNLSSVNTKKFNDSEKMVSHQPYKVKLRTIKGFDYKEEKNYVFPGKFPWEKAGVFHDIQKRMETINKQREYLNSGYHFRTLKDTFGDSLRHVNRLLNKEFGFENRKVPAHMPHLVDVDIMNEMQTRFPKEFDVTSSHRIRSSTDMQFAFSFFYFLMSEQKEFNVGEIFDEFDTDKSGTWSDREMRTLLTRIQQLPLTFESVKRFESIIINCSQHLPSEYSSGIPTPPFERYLDSTLPIVSRALILHCDTMVQLLKSKLKPGKKYRFETVGEDEIAFKMIQINMSQVIPQLDDIRKKPRKFICLNDNIDHRRKEAATVKAVLIDFYESLFPVPSQFELPRKYRNRFLHMNELREWRRFHDIIRLVTYGSLGVLIIFSLASFFHTEIKNLWKNFCLGTIMRHSMLHRRNVENV